MPEITSPAAETETQIEIVEPDTPTDPRRKSTSPQMREVDRDPQSKTGNASNEFQPTSFG